MRDRVKTWYLLFLFWSIFLFGSLTHRCDPPTTTNLMSLLVGWKRHNTIGFPFYRPLPSPINIQLVVNLRNKSLRARFLAPRTVWGERDRAINYVNSHLFFFMYAIWGLGLLLFRNLLVIRILWEPFRRSMAICDVRGGLACTIRIHNAFFEPLLLRNFLL